tara:strand:- start:354 stop:647 length:294 start_codon:yes stop_codon:yes gene_type:complete
MRLHSVIQELENIKSGNRVEYLGLCDHIHLVAPETMPAIKRIFKKWPKFSGHILYPVPSPFHNKNAEYAFLLCDEMYYGEYGKLRLELLDFILEELK